MGELKRVRRRVERKLRQRGLRNPIPERDWQRLVAQSSVMPGQDEDDDELTISTLKEWWEADATLDARPARTVMTHESPDPRYQALGEILALQAARDPWVAGWRERHLDGGLLDPAEVPAFLERLAADSPPTVKISAFADAASVRDLDAETVELQGWPVRYEPWPAVCRLPDGTVHHGPVVGPLRELVGAIAPYLAARFEWDEPDAVTFVLTGVAPRWYAARATGPAMGHEWSRIELSVDPRSPPKEVATLYELVRKNALGASPTTAPRRLDEKSARLAVFLAENDAATWAQRCTRWNERYPRWRYDDARSFRRDATKAWERVVGEKWPSPA